MKLENMPEYRWLRGYKKIHSQELLRRHGAHSIGIGWKKIANENTGRLALIFYVQNKNSDIGKTGKPIPSKISFTPTEIDSPIVIETDVVEAPPAEFEGIE